MANDPVFAPLAAPRRVVTGLDDQGRSRILIDGPAEAVIWATDAVPADNAGQDDAGGVPFLFPTSGTRLAFTDFPAGRASAMHATDTIDYIVIVSGAIVFITETGEVTLKAGDVLVDRGALHGWRNDGDAVCRMVIVLVPALPLGKGATVAMG